MPTYIYECINCKLKFDSLQPIEKNKIKCPQCNKVSAVRKFTPNKHVIFKGDNWASKGGY